MLSLSAHKFHGPKGIGALYVRKGTKFRPFIRGGHQERARRGGTENVPGIIGLGKAAELAVAGIDDERSRVGGLRDRLQQGVLALGHCAVTGDPDNRLPNTLNVAFENIEGEAILHHLNRAGVAASTGSACTAGSTEPSHVLKAMNVPAHSLQGAIRLSLSRDNTGDDIDYVLEILPGIVAELRSMSPALQGQTEDLRAPNYA